MHCRNRKSAPDEPPVLAFRRLPNCEDSPLPLLVNPWFETTIAAGHKNRYGWCMTRSLTAILIREGDGFVALCPEVDVASQGASVEEAKRNLKEAAELFFECASDAEIAERLSSESFVSPLEVSVA